MSHTYAILEVSAPTYDEVARLLRTAEYDHVFHEEDGRIVIDMHGIALAKRNEGLQGTDAELQMQCDAGEEV